MYRKFHTLSISLFGDFVGYFRFKNGIFKCVGVDKNNLSMDAKAAGSKTCKRHENAIKVASTIIVDVCVWDPCQLRMVKAKFFDEGDGGRVPSWVSTILGRVDSVCVDSLVYSLFPFEAKDEVKVGFVQVNDAKPMDFEVAFFLENHHVDDIFPRGKK